MALELADNEKYEVKEIIGTALLTLQLILRADEHAQGEVPLA